MGWRSLLTAACIAALGVGCADDTPGDGGVDDGGGAMMDGGGGTDGGMVGTDGGGGGDDSGLPPGRCGDGMLNAGEECDDGNRTADDGCDAECQLECGDGMLQTGELCDPGIAAGETGACPASCDDGDPCTSDVITGTECTQVCVHAPITAPADDDMCCPAGANATNDNDCMPMCGNMVLEAGELCDVGSATDCPTSCNDMNSCTTDALMGAPGTCDAACTNTAITRCRAGMSDGCCPSGCTSTNDRDCSATCGNMVLDAGELCENGSATPCPTSCDDGNACTTDTLVGTAAMCNAECSVMPITTCSMTGDGCCPSGCTSSTDADCTVRCGNGIVEGSEECDDGNMTSGDGCSATCTNEATPPTAFRITDMDLMDPHIYLRPLFSCQDLTNMGALGQPSVNQMIQNAIQMDGSDSDTFLDLSAVAVFRPLSAGAATSPMSVTFPDCTTPMSSTMCSLPSGGTRVDATATNMTAGTCLGPLAGTERPYGMGVASVTAMPGSPCFVSDEQTLVVNLAGAAVTLQRAQISARYVGSPPTTLANGLIRGFLTEADAMATTLDLPVIGTRTIASLLPGGMGCCASHDDRDTIMMGGTMVRGWWFYLYFPTAAQVPYTEL